MKKFRFVTSSWERIDEGHSIANYVGENKTTYIEAKDLERAKTELYLCRGIHWQDIVSVEEVE